MLIDTNGTGLGIFWSQPYKQTIIKALFKEEKIVMTTLEVHEQIVPEVSRASVTNFLNELVDEGFLEYEENTCRGGIYRTYWQLYTLERFWNKVILDVQLKMTQERNRCLQGSVKE